MFQKMCDIFKSCIVKKKLMVTVFLLSYCYVLVSKGKRISHLTLNDWCLRTRLILFPEKFDWDKINCFLRDQSLGDLLYGWKFWSWIFIKPCCNGGRWSTFAGNGALFVSDVIDFAVLPAQRFWRETFSLLDIMSAVMWPRSNQWECALFGKNFHLYNK